MITREIYYKIQQLSQVSLSWVDIQKKYFSLEEAKEAAKKLPNSRLMQVDGKQRSIIHL